MSETPSQNVAASEETVLVADNVDEFVQRTRWQQILEARQQASDALRTTGSARAELSGSRHSEREVERIVREQVRAGVTSYILECEPLFQRTEAGRKLWTDTPLASASAHRLFAPEVPGQGETVTEVRNIQFQGDAPVTVDRPSAVGEPATISLRGVRDFCELGDARVEYEYSARVEWSRNPNAEETHSTTATVSVPVSFSREAYRATNALLNHIGPGLEFGADDNTVSGDYTDLLDKLDDE